MGAGKGKSRRAQAPFSSGVSATAMVSVPLDAVEQGHVYNEIYLYLRDFEASAVKREALKELQTKIKNPAGEVRLERADAETLAIMLDRVAADYSQSPGPDNAGYAGSLRKISKRFWDAR